MGNKIGYVLVELGWEYNDETYYRPESEGGKPSRIYLDKATAYKACHDLNKEHTNTDPYDGPTGPMYEVAEVEIDETI